MKYIIITGSSGLVGSETVSFFHQKGFKVIGIDNNLRKYFFGKIACTNWKKTAFRKYALFAYIDVLYNRASRACQASSHDQEAKHDGQGKAEVICR